MNKSLMILYVVLSLAIVAIVFLIIGRVRSGDDGTTSGAREAQESPAGSREESSRGNTAGIQSGAPAESSGIVARDAAPVREEDMTPFLRSEIAVKWQRELGYTPAEILAAQQAIRAQRYPEETVNDPGVIMRHLPPRHTGEVSIEEVTVAPQARAGQPIPFSIRGTSPSPSYHFTHFDILVQGPVIRIKARGHSDGETATGKGGAVTLDGTIDPLPPGDYRVEIPELGPMGSFPFTVTP